MAQLLEHLQGRSTMISQHQWDTLREQTESYSDLPNWARGFLAKPVKELSSENDVALETTVLEQSYIEFLDEQIELNARGKDWTALLENRRNALSPWVGKETSELSISGSSGTLRIRFDSTQSQVVWVESFDKG